jgi:hypothetical protein
MMRQLQGGAMPRHGRVGPLTPPVTDALGEDLRGDGVVKILCVTLRRVQAYALF